MNKDTIIAVFKTATEAAEAAIKIAPEDGGTCNFDTCLVKFPGRPRTATILSAAEEAGVHVMKFEYGLYKGCWTLGCPSQGQANRRTFIAERVRDALKFSFPYMDFYVHYQMD